MDINSALKPTEPVPFDGTALAEWAAAIGPASDLSQDYRLNRIELPLQEPGAEQKAGRIDIYQQGPFMLSFDLYHPDIGMLSHTDKDTARLLWKLLDAIDEHELPEADFNLFFRGADHQEEQARTVFTFHRKKPRKRTPPPTDPSPTGFPMDELEPKDGLLADIYKAMLATTERPSRELALVGAVSLMAVLASRRYRSETGLLTNEYFLSMAGSGIGKEAPRRAAKQLLTLAGLDHLIAPESMKSGSAVISTLENQPAMLWLQDEAGKLMQSLSDPRASVHLREVGTELLTLYSAAQSLHAGRGYADQKTKPAIRIHHPCVVFTGATTHSTLYSALSSRDALSGLLARFVIADAGEKRPKRTTPPVVDLEAVGQRIREHYDVELAPGNLAAVQTAEIQPTLLTVAMTDEARALYLAADDALDELDVEDTIAPLHFRKIEHTIKLAMIYAVALDPAKPEIDVTAWTWAYRWANWSVSALSQIAREQISDSSYERDSKAIENFIRDAEEGGRTGRDITRKFRSISVPYRDALLQGLLSGGLIGAQANGHLTDEPTKYARYVHTDYAHVLIG